MNAETQVVIDLLTINHKLHAWMASANSGPELREHIVGRLAKECIIAEYTTGINGALTIIVNDLLSILFDKVDWNAVLLVAKTEAGQLKLA